MRKRPAVGKTGGGSNRKDRAKNLTSLSSNPSPRRPATRYLIPVLWERSAYAALFVGALIMRLWDLGARAVHHDESLHGFFAWQTIQRERV